MCAVLLGATMSAKLNLPTKTLGTERFYYYEVGKNETIHDVATKIGVSKEDIIKFNPSARNGLVKKQLIFWWQTPATESIWRWIFSVVSPP